MQRDSANYLCGIIDAFYLARQHGVYNASLDKALLAKAEGALLRAGGDGDRLKESVERMSEHATR